MTPDPVGAGAAQQAARAELRRGEYHRDDPGWLQRFLHWLWNRSGDAVGSSGAGHALLLVALAVVVLAVVLGVRAGLPSRRVRNRRRAEDDPLAPLAAVDHRQLAAELSQQGRHAEALREWLRAAVAAVEERGVLPARPGRTGAAMAREAGPLLPTARAELAAATAAFDEVWYGGRGADERDVALARSAADAVRDARIARPLDATDQREPVAPR